MQRKIVTWLGALLSLAVIAYIAMHFDLRAAFASIRLADTGWLTLGVATYCLLFPLRGLRWAVLMRAVKPVTWKSATEVFTIGFMANNLLPARLGDVARAVVLAERERIPASATFSNVMLERVFDGLTVVGFLALVLWIEPPPSQWVSGVAAVMAAIFLGAVLVSAFVAWNEARALSVASWLLRPFPDAFSGRVLGLLGRLAKGLHTLKSPRDTIATVLLSILIWSAEVVVYAIVQRAFGLSISPFGLTLVMAILTLGLTAPSAPGFIGVYEGLIIQALAVYGIGDPIAPAFAITMHIIHFVPGTLLGLVFTWKSGLKLHQIRDAKSGDDAKSDRAALKEMELS